MTLSLRPLLSGRNYHALHQVNDVFRFDHHGDGQRLLWNPYSQVPGIIAMSNGIYSMEPLWYRHFYYTAEEERGLDCSEDLASPGTFRFDLSQEAAVCILTTAGEHELKTRPQESAKTLADRLVREERSRRLRFASRLHRSADQFLIRAGDRETIIAGYPWFTDWGRDTFIALRGLCLVTGRLAEAEQILCDWAGTVSEGMVPNRFPDGTAQPEYNSVDASLWYIIAIHAYLTTMSQAKLPVADDVRELLHGAIEQILQGYSAGTRYQIQADADGLLRAGQSGVQLTWMDAKVNDWVVTPRIGKPVEVQALWLNALWIGSQLDGRWKTLFERGRESFRKRFWAPELGYLYDVVDVNHQAGEVDAALRPNQILAVGGLPLNLLPEAQSRQVVQTIEKNLLTPLGLRTLAPNSPDYHPHYTGGIWQRDGAYHQGTAWPWLLGPFVDAWLRVHGSTEATRTLARAKFIQPVLDHLEDAGIGHVSEIADGDPTATPNGLWQMPRGCPFQAWSLAELLRLLEGPLANELQTPAVSIPPHEDVIPDGGRAPT